MEKLFGFLKKSHLKYIPIIRTQTHTLYESVLPSVNNGDTPNIFVRQQRH